MEMTSSWVPEQAEKIPKIEPQDDYPAQAGEEFEIKQEFSPFEITATEESINISRMQPNDAEEPHVYPPVNAVKVEVEQTTKDCNFASTLSTLELNCNVLHKHRLVTDEENFNLRFIGETVDSVNLPGSHKVFIKLEDAITEEGSWADHGTREEYVSSTFLNDVKKDVSSLLPEDLINGIKLYSCPHCEFRSDMKKFLDKHVCAHNTDKEKIFQCTLCQFRTKCNQSLSTHMHLHNGINKKHFLCPLCDYQTFMAADFDIHLQLHNSNGPKILKCPLCDFKTCVKAEIKKHHLMHYPNRQNRYACDICKYSTVHRYYFMRHMRIHDTNRIKEFACEQCPYRTDVKASLAIHIANHDVNRSKQYCCFHCDFKTYDKSNLRQHVLCHIKDRVKPHACPHCNYRSDHKYALTVHLLKHNDQYVSIKSHICKVCPYRTDIKSHFQRHLRKHDKNRKKPYQCGLCHYATDDNNYLVYRHMRKHHGNRKKNLLCLECDYRTDCKLTLKRHVAKIHKTNKKIEAKFPWMLCNGNKDPLETDSKHTPEIDSLHTHETDCIHTFQMGSKHTTEIDGMHLHDTIHDKIFCCPHCDYISISKLKMEFHINTHNCTEIQSFHCDFCEFTTLDNRIFVAHVRHHSDNSIQSFNCEQCDYRTAYQASLTKHILTHVADDFSCSLCSYSTNEEAKFVDHLAAPKCKKEVTAWQECKIKLEKAAPPGCKDKLDKVTLLGHRRKHDEIALRGFHDEIPWFGCEACDYTTSCRSFIIKHLRSHSCSKRGNSYKCPVCPFKAPLQTSILLHMARRHVRRKHKATTSRPKNNDSFVEINVEVIDDVRVGLSDVGSILSGNSGDCVRGDAIFFNGNDAVQKCVPKINYEGISGTVRTIDGNMFVDQSAPDVINHANKGTVFFYSCTKCSYKAERLAVFARHMNKHEAPEKAFVCVDCDFQTDKKHDLALHARLHMTGRKKKQQRKQATN